MDAGTTFIYTLADSSVFGINQSSGLVTLKGSLDFETTTSYALTVTASDGALSNDASITVNVTNVNEAPVAGNATYSIDEDGTWSGAHTYDQATDVDAGTTFIYTLSDSSVFGIDQGTGLVTLKVSLDFETTTSYALTVTASDGALSNDALITVNVTNVNEAPVAGDATYSIDENGTWGGAHTYDQATDVDAGTTFVYTLSDSSVFGIDQGTGLVTLKGSLDFETTTSYALTVTASDGALSNDASITVNVTNVNEAPVAGDATYSIDENGAWGGARTYDQATDVDAGTTFIYTLSDSSVFGINQSSGLVTLKGSLDFETTSSYALIVTASDGALSNDALITVNVTNVNEAPVAGDATYSIDEGGAWSGAHTYDQAADVDAGTTFIYTLADSSVFGINQSSGLVTLKGSLDFETTTSYALTVTASDGALSSDASITVNVTNVNEAPVAGNATYSIDEDGTWSGAHTYDQATDVDAGTTFIYTLADSSVFGINQSSGLVTLKGSLDFETTTSYALTVTASDGAFSTAALISVNVTNVNEVPFMTIANLTIDENSLAGTKVDGTISALDEENDMITWELPEDINTDNILFNIDPLTGELTLKQDSTINYEITDKLSVLIIAKDEFLSTSQVVEITVGDVNDAPVIEDQTISLYENSPSGVVLDTIRAVDEDESDILSYSIISDNDIFNVNTVTGEISIKAGESLDFEKQNTYTLEIKVSDGEFNDTARVTINVDNVIEYANIELVEIFDDNGHNTNVDEFYTSADSVNVVVNKNGIIDTVKYAVDEGLNFITTTNNDPTKDIHEEIKMKVMVSTVIPKLEIITIGSVPIDDQGTMYVNNLETDSVWVKIRYINKNFKTVSYDSLIAIETFIEEGKKKTLPVIYEDIFGNKGTIAVVVVLDTSPPSIEITIPGHRSNTEKLEAKVEWTVVDNQDTLLFNDKEVLSSGYFAINRSYSDFAGNTVSDRHVINVTADDAKSIVKVLNPLVQQKTEEEIIEYFEIRERVSDPAFDNFNLDTDNDGIPDREIANISVIIPNSPGSSSDKRTLVEMAVQTDMGLIERTEFEEFEVDKNESRFGLEIEVFFPLNGGVNTNSDSRSGVIPENYFNEVAEDLGWLEDITGTPEEAIKDSIRVLCDGDTTIWKLRVEMIKFHIFDQLGQYVGKMNFGGLDIVDPRLQDDEGRVTLQLEIPQLKSGFKSEAGQIWGSGVYIMNGVVKSSATPKACLEHIKTLNKRTSSSTLLKKIGYKREPL